MQRTALRVAADAERLNAMAGSTILIVDDEAAIRASLAGILEDEGYVPLLAAGAEEGLQLLDDRDVSLVLLDIWMPGMDGLDALRQIRRRFDLPVIMMSGHGTIETAVEATRNGAYDFIEKPLSYDKVIHAIAKALQFDRLARENRILREKGQGIPPITGQSAGIVELREQIRMVAPTDASVLILGEHGTGKELVAQTIHHLSPRGSHPMVEVNCAAIPEDLIESELFGHVKGAFTGAAEERKGKFDQANGSSLLLDEIGDMSLKSQAKVLRILQEHRFERVGGTRTIEVDVRILAATNKRLEEEIERGSFRADLFYRLNVVPIVVPSLAARREDIPLLVGDFITQFQHKGIGGKTFTPGALELMQRHDWPGNVRELRNLVERLMIMSTAEEIGEEDVARFLGISPARPLPEAGSAGRLRDYTSFPFKEARQHFESDYLLAKLEECEGNVSKTAEQIGMERSHLHRKLKNLGIRVK